MLLVLQANKTKRQKHIHKLEDKIASFLSQFENNNNEKKIR
jgi:hypothetical protein